MQDLSLYTRASVLARRCLPALAFLLMPAAALAQTGTVTYAHTLKLDMDLPEEMAQFREFMPPSLTTSYAMAFSGEKALSRFLDVKDPRPARS